ncbi:tail fiber protein [Paenibacillus sanguinis]|uniref:tail fiber protein n=1 Tax=Paenibacillus sanguinis TaxID=225906 RepID=UPI0003824541|nr:tail fiber protein [Paenibacillus sanguinis]
MPIKPPRRFTVTDQGHADVLNNPIDTLYENDQELQTQIESIRTNPTQNGIVSSVEFQNHANNSQIHITAAERTAWDASESNAKAYTDLNAAKKSHTHTASDLPSATTQARGVTQLNTSTSSTATDQAATPSAVKAAYDKADAAWNASKTGPGTDYTTKRPRNTALKSATDFTSSELGNGEIGFIY